MKRTFKETWNYYYNCYNYGYKADNLLDHLFVKLILPVIVWGLGMIFVVLTFGWMFTGGGLVVLLADNYDMMKFENIIDYLGIFYLTIDIVVVLGFITGTIVEFYKCNTNPK